MKLHIEESLAGSDAAARLPLLEVREVKNRGEAVSELARRRARFDLHGRAWVAAVKDGVLTEVLDAVPGR